MNFLDLCSMLFAPCPELCRPSHISYLASHKPSRSLAHGRILTTRKPML